MDDFEKACNEVSEEYTGSSAQENAIDFVRNSKTMTVMFSQPRFVTKVEKLAEKYPNEVEICKKNPDGSVIAHMPVAYLKLSKPKEVTAEQKEAGREALKRLHESKKVKTSLSELE